jgi:hypothetical protein
VVQESPEALKLRRRLVQVHELEDGTVMIRHSAHELNATSFRKGGSVRQQDVVDNKYLALTLERIRKAQIANDLQQLESKMSKREKAALRASLAERATPSEFSAATPASKPAATDTALPATQSPRPVTDRRPHRWPSGTTRATAFSRRL